MRAGAIRVMIGLAIAAAGCSHGAYTGVSLSKPGVGLVMCKHCNCTMPADLDPESACPVCHCRYKVKACHRGGGS